MQVTIVHVHVKPEHIEDFLDATRVNHEASVQELGNCRFDILQQADDPSRFVLYEAYHTKHAAAAHKDTEHYLLWRTTVQSWMASDRIGIPYNGLLPEEL